MRFMGIVVVLALVLAAGCGKKEPVTAHGKPVAYWLEESRSADAKARKKAVTALGHVGSADPGAIPALMGAVKDADVAVRREAVLALLNIGPDAKDAIAVLTGAKNDQDATVRTYA